MFDALLVGILLYGVELWGYKEREAVERIQVKYIKCSLGLRIRTPNYLVLEETNRVKMSVYTGQRALRFEESVRSREGERNIVMECLKEKEKNKIQKTRSEKERDEYLKRNGYSQEGIELLRLRGAEEKEKLRNRDEEVQRQEHSERIRGGKYNPRYNYIRSLGLPQYPRKEGRGGSQGLITRSRCGNLENWNEYWKKEEKRKCGLCGGKFGTLEHWTREYRAMERGVGLEEIMSGKEDGKVVK